MVREIIDWATCQRSRMAKSAKVDVNLISSLREIAEEKISSAYSLSEEHHYSRISLLYDALRSYLECLALQHSFKIYNHECFTSFLKEVLHESVLADEFDKCRFIRNGINYYGRKLNPEEAHEIIRIISLLISSVKNLLK